MQKMGICEAPNLFNTASNARRGRTTQFNSIHYKFNQHVRYIDFYFPKHKLFYEDSESNKKYTIKLFAYCCFILIVCIAII